MSLHTLAKHVQQKGRGKDQMLVHMTPKEVQGLQALAKAHGGSLTINPETGLAEAGFLEQVLPIVAMAAATYFTAGAAAPALSAALAGETALAAGTVTAGGGALAGGLAGAGVGATGAALQGKDVGQGALYGGLGGAIAGGMGAYGGPESAAVTGAKEAAQTSQAVQGVNSGSQLTDITKQIANAPSAGDFAGSASDPTAGMAAAANTGMPPVAPPPPTPNPAEFARQSLIGESYAVPRNPALGYAGTEQGIATPSVMPQGPTPSPGVAPSYYSTMGMPGKAMALAAPGIGADIGMNQDNTPIPTGSGYTSASTLSPDFQGYTPPQPNPYYRAQYTRYAADGGLMALSGGGDPRKKKQRASLTADRTMAAMSADQAGLANLNNARYAANMTGASPLSSMTLGDLPANAVAGARGGLADLGGYSDGGRLLKGPGDGMSDNIPAQIGRKQPARLADGEFVVPADVVSHLGNGSTDAGAKRLYAMMDRARQARTGKKKQAPAVNADKILSRVA
jgi:hypothetical protein